MTKYIDFKFNLPVFIIAFALAFLYVYLFGPQRKTILKYPTPYNSNKLIYHNSSGDCYMYKADKVTCLTDQNDIIPQPV